jgi:hypothetical protein
MVCELVLEAVENLGEDKRGEERESEIRKRTETEKRG